MALLSVASYNCTGFGPGKPEYVAKLLECNDFVFIQEHWLRNAQFHRVNNIPCNGNFDVMSHIVSAMDDGELRAGRGFGGCAILWKSTLNCKVYPVQMTSSRICAVKLVLQQRTYLLFNVYMPCDVRKNFSEYASILDETRNICQQLNVSNYVLGGDFNTSFSRHSSAFTNHIKHVMEEENMYCCLSHEKANINYTFVNPADVNSRHVIDHFFVNHDLYGAVMDHFSVHEGDNVSFHEAIVLKLNLDVEYLSLSDRIYVKKPQWNKASHGELSRYRNVLDDLLGEVDVPWDAIRCDNVMCNDRANHCDRIQVFHDSLVNACLLASDSCIPKTGSKPVKTRNVAGWSEYVKPYRDASIFWHNVWKECGSPRNSRVADVMRGARAKYHKMVKLVKANETELRKNKMAQALLEDKSRNFWDEVRKVSRNADNIPNLVDDVAGDEQISELFREKYESLYNSVSYDNDEMTTMIAEIEKSIAKQNCDLERITPKDISYGLKHVKPNKSDGCGMLYTDHFVNGTHLLFTLLSFMYNVMIWHGFSPDGLNKSTIVPIVKDKRKSLNDSSNYRAISLSSPLAKLLDWIILDRNKESLSTNELQFGFKRDSSTSKCTFALMECVNHFRKNNSNAYVLLLDASKAFDRVNYVKLFRLLLAKGVNPFVVRCLINMYTNQHLNVSWNGRKSEYFTASNGVKQGGVLSPILFINYIDELFNRLKESGFGCMVGHVYVSGLGYADDVALLAPTLYALKNMCNICNEFASEFDLKFNTAKCQLVPFGDNENVCLRFNGIEIKGQSTAKHLGHEIGSDIMVTAARQMANDMTWRAISVVSNFSYCSVEVRRKLFLSFCTSFYGICLLDLQSKEFDNFYTAWRKVVRKVFNVPVRTHSRLLPGIAECLPIKDQICERLVRFAKSCQCGSNSCIVLFINMALNDSGSYMSNSLNAIECDFRINKYEVLNQSLLSFRRAMQDRYIRTSDINTLQTSAFIIDTLRMIDNNRTLLSSTDLKDILFYLCTC